MQGLLIALGIMFVSIMILITFSLCKVSKRADQENDIAFARYLREKKELESQDK